MTSSPSPAVSSPLPLCSSADLDPDLLLEKAKRKNKNVGWQMAFAGALSGAASRTLVAPFDRVKLLAQVAAVPGSLSTSASSSSSSSPSLSSSSSSSVARATARRSTAATLRAIYEADGVRGLFRGNVAALLRTIPYSAVQLSTHDLLKRSFAARNLGAEGGEASPSSPSSSPQSSPLPQSSPSPQSSSSSSTSTSTSSAAVALPTGARLAAAAGAGVAAAAVSHPLDTLRLRLALPTASGAASRAASSSLITTAATVVRTEGFFSLYRGLSAAVLGAAPFSAISLMTFDRLQSLAAAKRKREWSEQKGEVLPEAAAAATMTMFLPSTSSPSLSPAPPSLQAPAWEAALAGAFAGAVASTATYPIDTLRRRLQLPTSTSVAGCVGAVPEESAAAAVSAEAAKANSLLRSSHTRSLVSAAATAIRHDGFFSLYRGWVVGTRQTGFYTRQTGFNFFFRKNDMIERALKKTKNLPVVPLSFKKKTPKNNRLRQAGSAARREVRTLRSHQEGDERRADRHGQLERVQAAIRETTKIVSDFFSPLLREGKNLFLTAASHFFRIRSDFDLHSFFYRFCTVAPPLCSSKGNLSLCNNSFFFFFEREAALKREKKTKTKTKKITQAAKSSSLEAAAASIPSSVSRAALSARSTSRSVAAKASTGAASFAP